MGQPKPKYKAMLTPEQQNAQAIMNSYISGGPSANKPYTGQATADWSILDPSTFADILSPGAKDAGIIPGMADWASGMIKQMALTGMPIDQTAEFAKERELAATSAKRSVEAGLAIGQRFGSILGSNVQAAARAAGAEKQLAGDVDILGKVAASQEAAKQRQVQALGMVLQGAQFAKQYKLDAAKIMMAANQFTKTANYEQWKTENPDVYAMANAMFQNKLDWVAEQKKDWVGPALMAVAAVVATVATGGAAAPLIAGAVSNAASVYNSPTTSPIGPSSIPRVM